MGGEEKKNKKQRNEKSQKLVLAHFPVPFGAAGPNSCQYFLTSQHFVALANVTALKGWWGRGQRGAETYTASHIFCALKVETTAAVVGEEEREEEEAEEEGNSR